jgi:hypothetical protein
MLTQISGMAFLHLESKLKICFVMKRELQKDNSKLVLAFILIGVGVLWALKTIGVHFEFPQFIWENLFYPLRHVFHNVGHIIFSWPMVFIFIGGVLLAGKRSIGWVFLIVGGIFILPKLFFFPGLTISFALPVLLIGIGVAIIVKRI